MTQSNFRAGHDAGVIPENKAQAEITACRVESWLKVYLANLLDVGVQAIGSDQSFSRLGLDSATAIAMTGDMAEWLGCEIDAMTPYEFTTISTLSRQLGNRADIQAALAVECRGLL